jgi:uncharacterized protein (DUF2164 family)
MEKVRRGLDLLAEKDKELCLKEIATYFERERGEIIGLIAARDILDFFLQNIGPAIYNQAIEETKNILKKQLEGLDFEFDLLKKQK